jgi:hypothetical protein
MTCENEGLRSNHGRFKLFFVLLVPILLLACALYPYISELGVKKPSPNKACWSNLAMLENQYELFEMENKPPADAPFPTLEKLQELKFLGVILPRCMSGGIYSFKRTSDGLHVYAECSIHGPRESPRDGEPLK